MTTALGPDVIWTHLAVVFDGTDVPLIARLQHRWHSVTAVWCQTPVPARRRTTGLGNRTDLNDCASTNQAPLRRSEISSLSGWNHRG